VFECKQSINILQAKAKYKSIKVTTESKKLTKEERIAKKIMQTTTTTVNTEDTTFGNLPIIMSQSESINQ
jgi:hypothetical protein